MRGQVAVAFVNASLAAASTKKAPDAAKAATSKVDIEQLAASRSRALVATADSVQWHLTGIRDNAGSVQVQVTRTSDQQTDWVSPDDLTVVESTYSAR